MTLPYQARTSGNSFPNHTPPYKYNTVNMLLKSIFSTAERNQLIDYNPAAGIFAKGGKPAQKKDALTDEQVKVLLDTIRNSV